MIFWRIVDPIRVIFLPKMSWKDTHRVKWPYKHMLIVIINWCRKYELFDGSLSPYLLVPVQKTSISSSFWAEKWHLKGQIPQLTYIKCQAINWYWPYVMFHGSINAYLLFPVKKTPFGQKKSTYGVKYPNEHMLIVMLSINIGCMGYLMAVLTLLYWFQ